MPLTPCTTHYNQYTKQPIHATTMLPQFELQKKRRMHAKRRRQEQRQKIFTVVVTVLCLLGAMIVFNVYYIFRNEPQPSGNSDVRSQTGTGNVRRRGPWITADAQPFVSTTYCLVCFNTSKKIEVEKARFLCIIQLSFVSTNN